MSDPVTWGDVLTIAKWYVAVSIGIWFLAMVASLLWSWWEDKR